MAVAMPFFAANPRFAKRPRFATMGKIITNRECERIPETMLPEPSSLPKAYPAPQRKVPKNVRVPRPLPVYSPRPTPTIAPPSPSRQETARKVSATTLTLRRPGCVTATALFFAGAALFATLGLAGSLVLADLIGIIGNMGQAILLTVTAIGLWFMYRWAVHLVILFCITNIIRLFLFPVVSYVIVDEWVHNSLARIIMIVTWGGMVLLGVGVLGWILRWFAKTRRFFLENDIFPQWEQSLYILAIVILVFDLITSMTALPDLYESQRAQFEEIDRQSEDITR
jgi:hypothetical protein